MARWIRQSEGLERQLEPAADVLFAAAGLAPGERVLDVGCGTGPTTRRAAQAVGPDGAVIGLDVAGPMLDHAASIPVPPGRAPIEWIESDATTWEPEDGLVDVVLSRFGVMFFTDPAAAFANLAGACATGGRLHMAVWAERTESEMFEVPLQVALRTLDRLPDATVPEEPPRNGGPFSLGDAQGTRALLEGAGWSDVGREVHRLRLPFAGGLPPAEAARASLDFGPTRIVTAEADDAARAEVVAAIAEAYGNHLDGHGHVVLDGTVIILSARRS